MADRKRIDDFSELVHAAVNELHEALCDGDEKYPPGSWKDETIGNHINHLNMHMKRIQAGEWQDENGHFHVSHVVCRAIMMAALRSEELLRQAMAEAKGETNDG